MKDRLLFGGVCVHETFVAHICFIHISISGSLTCLITALTFRTQVRNRKNFTRKEACGWNDRRWC